MYLVNVGNERGKLGTRACATDKGFHGVDRGCECLLELLEQVAEVRVSRGARGQEAEYVQVKVGVLGLERRCSIVCIVNIRLKNVPVRYCVTDSSNAGSESSSTTFGKRLEYGRYLTGIVLRSQRL